MSLTRGSAPERSNQAELPPLRKNKLAILKVLPPTTPSPAAEGRYYGHKRFSSVSLVVSTNDRNLAEVKNTGALCRRSQLRWVAMGFALALVALSAQRQAAKTSSIAKTG